MLNRIMNKGKFFSEFLVGQGGEGYLRLDKEKEDVPKNELHPIK
jgi:hypothetical protein